MTPQQQYYSVGIRLLPEDKEKIDILRKKGLTVIAILRSGIETELKKVGKK